MAEESKGFSLKSDMVGALAQKGFKDPEILGQMLKWAERGERLSDEVIERLGGVEKVRGLMAEARAGSKFDSA